jgi:hypothetical protein
MLFLGQLAECAIIQCVIKRSTAITVSVFGAIAIVSAILLFSEIANAPHAASIISTTNGSRTPASFNMYPVTVSNNYISFRYPKLLKPTQTSLVSGEVAAYTFMHRDIATWNMAVEVMPLPNGGLQGNSAYEMRKSEPATYTESTFTKNGQSVDVMTDTSYGGFSKVAFLTHGQYQATISLFGDDSGGTNALQQTFNMIIDSWKWR